MGGSPLEARLAKSITLFQTKAKRTGCMNQVVEWLCEALLAPKKEKKKERKKIMVPPFGTG
jgi:hypothetical protein